MFRTWYIYNMKKGVINSAFSPIYFKVARKTEHVSVIFFFQIDWFDFALCVSCETRIFISTIYCSYLEWALYQGNKKYQNTKNRTKITKENHTNIAQYFCKTREINQKRNLFIAMFSIKWRPPQYWCIFWLFWFCIRSIYKIYKICLIF